MSIVDPSIIAPAPTSEGDIRASIAGLVRRVARLEATEGRTPSLDGQRITANTIGNDQIVAGAITADLINVTSLQSLSAIMGNLQSGNITLNAGSWIRTAAVPGSGQVEFSPAGVKAWDSLGNEKFNLSAATGIVSAVAFLASGSTVPGDAQPVNSVPGDRIVTNSLDAAKIVADSITTAKLAAGAVTLAKANFTVNGFNHLPDSSFELVPHTGTTPLWTASGAATQTYDHNTSGILTAMPPGGRFSRVIYVSGADPYIYYRFLEPALSKLRGQKVTFSAYVRRPATAPAPGGTHRSIYAGANGTGAPSAFKLQNELSAADVWERQSVTITVPVDATQLELRLYSSYSDTTNGRLFYDGLQVEIGGEPTPWRQYIDPTYIDSDRIVSAKYQTALSGARLEIDSTGLKHYNASNATLLSLTPASGLNIISSAVDAGVPIEIVAGVTWLDPVTLTTVNPAGSVGTKQYLVSGMGAGLDGYYRQLLLEARERTASSPGTAAAAAVLAKTVEASGTEWFATILNKVGGSSFLQLASIARRRVAFGQATMTFSSSGFFLSNVTVTHNLNGTPVYVGWFLDENGGGTMTAAEKLNIRTTVYAVPNANQVTIGARNEAGAGSPVDNRTAVFRWLVIV